VLNRYGLKTRLRHVSLAPQPLGQSFVQKPWVQQESNKVASEGLRVFLPTMRLLIRGLSDAKVEFGLTTKAFVLPLAVTAIRTRETRLKSGVTDGSSVLGIRGLGFDAPCSSSN
jgi:hypothetical protein